LDQEDDTSLEQVEYSVLEPYHKNDIATKKHHDERKSKVLFEKKGFCKEGGEGDGY
jgi:U6 snRNA-associated Sm-like protein LSm1